MLLHSKNPIWHDYIHQPCCYIQRTLYDTITYINHVVTFKEPYITRLHTSTILLHSKNPLWYDYDKITLWQCRVHHLSGAKELLLVRVFPWCNQVTSHLYCWVVFLTWHLIVTVFIQSVAPNQHGTSFEWEKVPWTWASVSVRSLSTRE